MPVYRTTGTLTGTIEPENVAAAQRYLQFDHDGTPTHMERYLDPPLNGVVESLQWHLSSNGHDYYVEAFTTRPLNKDELEQLAAEVSGQNSDGLGEGFEQQPFAETGSYYSDSDARGNAYYEDDEEYEEDGGMISFDWQSNDSKFELFA